MSAFARLRATLLAVVLTCALPLGSAQATPSTENVATATATQDGTRVFDFAWDYSATKGDAILDNHNEAAARSQCTSCGATAIAFQIVIRSGSPSVVVPVNLAQSYNFECTDCENIAEARQFVRLYPEPVKLTSAGKAILADVRQQLRALDGQNVPADQVHQVVETQEARVRSVLRDELVLKSDPDETADVVLQQRTLQDEDLG